MDLEPGLKVPYHYEVAGRLARALREIGHEAELWERVAASRDDAARFRVIARAVDKALDGF